VSALPAGTWMFLVVMAVVVVVVIGMYNRLVSLRQRARGAWADIDAHLKRRADLVGNLVETVKGYATHEERTLSDVTKWRSASAAAREPQAAAAADTGLTAALRSLFAVAEAYPDLKADTSFLGLQSELSQIESDALSARRYYNAVVRDYNTALETFPSSLVATLGAFRSERFFELDAVAERQPPRVSFER
jgi:LemA protein